MKLFKAVTQIALMSFFLLLIAGLSAFAQTATPAPTPLDAQALVNGAIGVATSWKTAGVWAGISALIYFLINVLKTGTFKSFFDKILSQNLQALFVAALGVVAVVIGGYLAGGALVPDLILGFQSSAGAVLLHEIIKDVLPASPPAA